MTPPYTYPPELVPVTAAAGAAERVEHDDSPAKLAATHRGSDNGVSMAGRNVKAAPGADAASATNCVSVAGEHGCS